MSLRSNSANDVQKRLLARFVLAAAILVFLASTSFSQELPEKIRGYRVYSEKLSVVVGSSRGKPKTDASVKIGEPEIVQAGLEGLSFEFPAEILAARQSGKVDFLSFRDVKVNGIAVEVEEYRSPFTFRKGEAASLPMPARVFLPATGVVRAAWKEMSDSQDEWSVSGRVFIFGRFRRFGMYHKRVVPVDFDVKIRNPLARK